MSKGSMIPLLLVIVLSFSLFPQNTILDEPNLISQVDENYDAWVQVEIIYDHDEDSNSAVTMATFSPLGNHAVTSGATSSGAYFLVWNVENWTIDYNISVNAYSDGEYERIHGSFSPNGDYFAINVADYSNGNSNDEVRVYETQTWQQIHSDLFYLGEYGTRNCIQFTPDSNNLIVGQTGTGGGGTSVFSIWDVGTWNKIHTFEQYSKMWGATSCTFSTDGSYFISSHADRGLMKWITSNWTYTDSNFLSGSETKWSPGVKTSSNNIMAYPVDNIIKLYDFNISSNYDNISASDDPTSIAFSPDGEYIVAGLQDGSLEIWNLTSKNLVEAIPKHWSSLESHQSAIRVIEFDPDGNMIISGSDDGTVRIWDLDFDEDGLGNSEDPDDDGDSWSDSDEIYCGTNGLDNRSVPLDYDGDGICNIVDEEDLWIKLELNSWEADQSIFWDSDNGLPDPRFHVTINVDGNEIGSVTSQTWDDTWVLGNSWNFTIDIDENTKFVEIEIQCKDNDAINDDECDMNREDGEWKLFFKYDLSGLNSANFSGAGYNDNDTSWRDASSNWTVSLITFDEVDSDGDGVINLYDQCVGFDDSEDADSDGIPDGCDDFTDSDGDGVPDADDQCEGYDDSDDFDDDGEPSGCDTDDDNDGTPDVDDGCPNTPLGAIVDWGCPMDSDEDGVYDGLDDCPNSVGYSGVDSNGCDLDSDSDGVPDFDDECANTPQGESLVEDFNYWGCSSSQIDSDSDGVNDHIDLCPNSVGDSGVDSNGCDLDSDSDDVPDFDDECANTPQGATVDYMGCPSDLDGDGVFVGIDECPNTPQGSIVNSLGCSDVDGDGVYDSLDECANTPAGATADFKGCPMDSDSDGVYDGIDECPSSNNPSPSDMDKSSEVDSSGCFIDTAGSESDSGSAAFGCLGMIFMVGMVVFVFRKVRRPKHEQMFYAQTQPVIPVQQQYVPTPQVSSREKELENQSRQAQIEAQRLRQQLAKQAQLTQQLQSEAAQKQMTEAALAQKQQRLAVALQEKEELEAKLAEAEKNAPIVQNITYNIQDSAISGDITNKITRNDLE